METSEIFLMEPGLSPEKPAKQSLAHLQLLPKATPAWHGGSLSNVLERAFGEVVLSISYFSCVALVKLHLRLEYQAHSTLPLQRSGPVHSSSRSYLFPAQGWNLWSLEGKPSYLITEFFLAWLLVARMQMGSRYSSLDRPLSCPAPLRPRHSALSCR